MGFARCLGSLLLVSVANMGLASEYTRNASLWLPKSYQQHFTQLMKAAEVVATSPDCFRLINGTLMEARSTPSHPFFQFKCRNEQRQLFTVIVDGQTLVTHQPLDKHKQALVAEADRKKREEQKKYWAICEEEFYLRTELMRKRKILTRLPPKPTHLDKETLLYAIEFDAVNNQGKPLAYHAECKISGLETYNVRIKPRGMDNESGV